MVVIDNAPYHTIQENSSHTLGLVKLILCFGFKIIKFLFIQIIQKEWKVSTAFSQVYELPKTIRMKGKAVDVCNIRRISTEAAEAFMRCKKNYICIDLYRSILL
jgi:hypothetical protein